VPKFASSALHDTLPSAALAFTLKPGGRVTVSSRIDEGGTASSELSPEGESASVVVGLAFRLGLKVS
jgi:hypothetical protein